MTKQELNLHGKQTEEDIFQAPRMVQDYLVQNRGAKNFEVTTDLSAKCKNSHA